MNLVDKQKLLEAIVGAKNMASIFQNPSVIACLEQLREKLEAGDFDYRAKYLKAVK